LLLQGAAYGEIGSFLSGMFRLGKAFLLKLLRGGT